MTTWCDIKWTGVWRLLLGLLLVATSGCHTAVFYRQAVVGHLSMMARKKPISKVLDDPATRSDLREKLEEIGRLCRFAEGQLELPANGHYRHYADLGRPFVVWDIYAAPEFSLEPKRWRYPFVGSLSYRGYYAQARAEAYAHFLERRGYEVYVGGVEAYSTLGWFRDPVLNTFVFREELDLADLIFHELAHQRCWIEGDTDLNEAFATAVAREGVRRWLLQEGRDQLVLAWQDRMAREDRFAGLIMATRERLKALYAAREAEPREGSPPPGLWSAENLRAGKAAVFSQMRADYEKLKESWGGHPAFDTWFEEPINNARLNAEATYHELVPALENLLALTGHNLGRFYEEVDQLGRLDRDERRRILQGWLPEVVRRLASPSSTSATTPRPHPHTAIPKRSAETGPPPESPSFAGPIHPGPTSTGFRGQSR